MQNQMKILQVNANKIRLLGLEMAYTAGSGHLGGAFSLSEILSALYFSEMNIDPKQPDWEDRDRLVLSKGHGTVALYPTLALCGFFPIEHLSTFRKPDSDLSGHAEIHVPGVDMSTGSLGHGLSCALGMALSAKLHQQDYRTYAIVGDGELQEGQIWEAAMFAPNKGLNNLTVIVDHNSLQLDGPVKEINDLRDIAAKFSSFGWNTITADGHNIEDLLQAFSKARTCTDKPTVIVAKTIKGKGVSFMENNYLYHGKQPDEKGFQLAHQELEAAIAAEREEL